MNLRNTLFALICLCGQGFHGKPVAWGQVNRQRLEKNMYVALSQLLYLWDLDGQRGTQGFFKVIIRREGEKPQTSTGTFMGRHKKLPKELTTELLYLELLTTSASCGVTRYMHYIRFLLTKTSQGKQRSLNQFFFLDRFLFALLIFLSICK